MEKRGEKYYIVFDTETNGLPLQCKQKEEFDDFSKFASLQNREAYKDMMLLQLSMMKVQGNKQEMINFFVKPRRKINYDGFPRYYQMYYILNGTEPQDVIKQTLEIMKDADKIYIHNKNFDIMVLYNEIYELHLQGLIQQDVYDQYMDTMKIIEQKCICTLQKHLFDWQKPFMKLSDIYQKATGKPYIAIHDSQYDCMILQDIIQISQQKKEKESGKQKKT